MSREKKATSADELDRLFDEGSDEIDRYMDWPKGSTERRSAREEREKPE